MLDIQVEDADTYTVCRPVGELDAYTVGQFRDALGELADAHYLLIDLSAVPFMDSAGLGALIGGIRRAREAGGDRDGRLLQPRHGRRQVGGIDLGQQLDVGLGITPFETRPPLRFAFDLPRVQPAMDQTRQLRPAQPRNPEQEGTYDASL